MRKVLHHIKKAKTGGYQVQFIVKGKSYSGFAMKRKDAIVIRDQMEKKLAPLMQPSGYRKTPQPNKESMVPGTDRPMPAGITLHTGNRHGYKEYYIQVNWVDYRGKHRTKAFYACRESTYTKTKMKQTYSRAYQFRRAYEKAKREGKIKDFDHTQFNLKRG